MPRDANGNMTLPAGNPVVANTDITTAWANPTMADLAAEVQDSLSRSGKGGMLVPFQNQDGTTTNPGITFTNQTGTGWSRSALGVALSIAATAIARWTTTALDLLTGRLNLKATGAAANKVVSSVTDGATAVAVTIDTDNDLTTAGAKLLSIQNKGVEKFAIDKDGNPTRGLTAVVSGDCGVAVHVIATTWQDVTNLATGDLDLTGRPVLLSLQGTSLAQIYAVSGAGAGYMDVKVVRTTGGVDTDVSAMTVAVPAGATVYYTPNMTVVDIPPAAGTYSYRIQGQANSVGLDLLFSRLELVAVEL